MGRALYSSYIKSEPLVRTEPPPAATPQDPYRTWSAWNNFDPDSDEFFEGAQYEAFLQPSQPFTETPVPDQPALMLEDADSSSSSGESSDGDRGSPMAVGTDDPADMIANAYQGPSWGLAPEEWRYTQQRPTGRLVPPSQPSVSSEESNDTTTNMTAAASVAADTNVTRNANNLESVPIARFATANVTPIDIPVDPDMPDLVGTPSSSFRYGSPTQDLTPSPAPAFTPRIYTWGRIPATSVSPTRPTYGSNTRLPMTRMITPVRVRIQGFTVST